MTVDLSTPAALQGFGLGALTLSLNGNAVPMGDGVSIVQIADGTYQIQGLASSQTQPGNYVLTVDASQIFNPAGQAGSGTSSVSWFLDQSPPVASLFTTATAQTTPIPVTVLFSKPVSGFDAGEVQVGSALLTNFQGSGNLYSFDLTPTSPGVTVTASIPAGTARDAAGNVNTASSVFSLPLATTGPTVVVTSSVSGSTNQARIPLTVAFSRLVVTNADALLEKIVVTNGTLTVANVPTFEGVYPFTLQPSGPGPVTVSVQVPAGVAEDVSGNPNSPSAPFSITFDNTPPSVVLTSADSPGTFQSPIPVTVLFTKPVTGFTAAGVSVGNATLADFSGIGDRYSFNLVPNGIGPVTAQVRAAVAQDAAGNTNTSSNAFSRVFEVVPVATLYSPAGANTTSTDYPVYIQFNEPVRLDPSKITVVQGSIVGAVTQVTPTTYLIHVQPTLPVGQASTTVTVSLLQLAATDAFGNQNQQSVKYLFNYSNYVPLVPTLTLIGTAGAYNQVQLSFNQPSVTNFDASKIAVSSNATIWGFSGSGNLYNFYVNALPTQSDYGTSMTLTVTIPAGAATGADGLPLQTPAALTINTGTINGPTVTITSNQTHDYWNATAIPVTVTFSETVTGFTVNSLNNYAPNATVSNFQQVSQDPAQYTFDLTPVGTPISVQVGINPTGITGVPSGKPLTGLSFTFIRNLVTGPIVTNVTSNATGTERPGSLVPIQVTFSSPVIVNPAKGVPVLFLNAAGPGGYAMATYVNGGSPAAPGTTLTFNYVVQPGQRTAHLDELSSGALTTLGQTTLVSGSILDATTQTAIPIPVLFDPGSPLSLGGNSQIAIGASATGVIQVSSTKPDGIYGVGTVIPITVQFNGAVTVDTTGGTPTLALAVAGGTGTAAATYVSGSGTNTLTFDFTPAAGQTSPALDYASTGALESQRRSDPDRRHLEPGRLDLAGPRHGGFAGNQRSPGRHRPPRAGARRLG